MNFLDMLNALKTGAYMVRSGWTRDDGYLILMPGAQAPWKIIIKADTGANAGNYLFTVEDYQAQDWQPLDLTVFNPVVVVVEPPVEITPVVEEAQAA